MHNRLTCSLLTLLLGLVGTAYPAEPVTWLTGPALKKKLEQEVSVTWSGKPLRDALDDLARVHQVAILLDRRVDPSRPIELSLANVPLGQVFGSIAQDRGIGVCLFESLAYFGPTPLVERLRTLGELRSLEVNQLPAAKRLDLVRVRAWRWDDFATPQSLLAQVAKDGKIKLEGLSSVPHDLWAAADLPPMSIADRLTLVAGQFDLTVRWNADCTVATFVPIPEVVTIERSYPGGKEATELAKQFQEALPNCQIRVADGRVVIRGRLEDHEKITAKAGTGIAPAPPRTAKINLDDPTLRIQYAAPKAPLSAILEDLRTKLGLEFKSDPEQLKQAGRSLETVISVQFEKRVSINELLTEILKPAGLTFRRTGRQVEVLPAEVNPE